MADEMADLREELERVQAENIKLRALAEKNQREHDLVRQQRTELYVEGLITPEEYAMLASEHGGVQRLEDYDQLRAKLKALS